MTIILYELCAGDPSIRFSPHCWKARMALAHKGVAVETRATPFTRIGEIGGGFSSTVPVIEDDGRLVRDSFDIAVYLDEAYPDRPSLFAGAGGQAAARFVEQWAAREVGARLLTLIILDIHNRLDETDQAYFRESREGRFGRTLETVAAGRDERIGALRESLAPLRAMLAYQPFIGGDAPLFADYIVFGTLQWARVTSPLPILAVDDPVADWFGRCLDLHGGLGRAMPAAA